MRGAERQGPVYELTISRVISPGRAEGDGTVTVELAAGAARLRLRLKPRDAVRVAGALRAAAGPSTVVRDRAS